MHVTARSCLTSGIAALGVGAMALAPIQPLPTHVAAVPQHAVESMAVELAAAANPFEAWGNTIKTTLGNSRTLALYYLQNPFPLAQTWVANQATYLTELLTGNANLIPGQIKANLQTLFSAPLDPGPTLTLQNDSTNPPTEITFPYALPGSPGNISEACTGADPCGAPIDLSLLAIQLTAGAANDASPDNPDAYATWLTLIKASPLWRFSTSFASGLLMGAVGVVMSPLVSLGNSLKAFGADLKAGQLLSAVYDLVNIPANMTNAFFNGAGFMDLTNLVGKVAGIEIPEAVGRIGLNLGGLLNATPVQTPPTDEYNGGVAFDAIAGGGDGLLPDNGIRGIKVGLGGALVGMGQFLGKELKVTPPLQAATAAAAPAASAVEAPAVEAPAVEVTAPAEDSAPAVSAPSRRKARAAAASDGDNDRAGGHSRSARSSR